LYNDSKIVATFHLLEKIIAREIELPHFGLSVKEIQELCDKIQSPDIKCSISHIRIEGSSDGGVKEAKKKLKKEIKCLLWEKAKNNIKIQL
jgi:hypothetical protein